MTKTSFKISLYADDISTSDFISFINESYSDQSITATIETHEKKGRSGFGDFVTWASHNEIVVGLFVNMMYDVIKFAFQKLKSVTSANPIATVTMKNGVKTLIPMTLSNEDIRLQIVLCLSQGDVDSIDFDC